MKQYFAVSTQNQVQAILAGRYKNLLVSYFYWKEGNAMTKTIIENKNNFDNLLLDSGAFSAFNSGAIINIDEYIEAVKRINISKYFSLDAIGDAKGSFENYLYLKKAGLEPIPTFHINTDIDYLYKYLELADHISIGNMVQGNAIKENLNKIWSIILTTKPSAKVHGLGLSNFDIAASYPWDSIDSSSYAAITKFARVSIWNKRMNNFEVFDTFNWLEQKMRYISKDKTENPEDGKQRTSSGIDGMCFFIQQEQYNQMLDSINENQKGKDFNYLTSQLTINF